MARTISRRILTLGTSAPMFFSLKALLVLAGHTPAPMLILTPMI